MRQVITTIFFASLLIQAVKGESTCYVDQEIYGQNSGSLKEFYFGTSEPSTKLDAFIICSYTDSLRPAFLKIGQYGKSKDGFMAFNALDNGDCSYDQVCLDNGGSTYDCLVKEDDCKQSEKFTCYEPNIPYFFIEAAEGFVDSNGQFSALRIN